MLDAARFRQERGDWFLYLFLIMPDHIHLLAHFPLAEKWDYIVRNPVRRGLCAMPRDWPHVIAFDPATGAERPHR